MKKTILFVATIAIGVFATSCAKSRTCTCTTTSTSTTFTDFTNSSIPDQTTNSSSSSSSTTTIDKLKKKDARRQGCVSSNDTRTQVRNGGSGSGAYVETRTDNDASTCTLK